MGLGTIFAASTMEENQKYVNLCYLFVAALLSYIIFLLATKFIVAFDFDGRIRSLDMIIKASSVLLGVVTFLILNRSERVNTFMNEVIVELGKVTWPTQDETVKGTFAVLIAVVIAGTMLWVFDSIWIFILSFFIKANS